MKFQNKDMRKKKEKKTVMGENFSRDDKARTAGVTVNRCKSTAEGSDPRGRRTWYMTSRQNY